MTTEGLGARRAALRALRRVADGGFSNLVVPAEVAALEHRRDRALASHLAYETLRWQGTLDWMLDGVVGRGLAGVEPALVPVLRLGALQLTLSDVPPHAAVSTSVELARESVPSGRARGAAGFVNGVLRALARRVGGSSSARGPRRLAGDFDWPDSRHHPVEHLALVTGHPEWVVAELHERFGERETRAVLDGDNEPPGLTLRATRDRDGLVAELRAVGEDAAPGARAPEAVRVPGGDPGRLDAVAEGRAVPQDEASMLVVRAAGVRPGDRVLDCCAGPGGKATHLAALAGDAGQVVALDLHPSRARLVAELADRVDVSLAVAVADATAPPLGRRFDVVLVDAPCTGLGTGRRRPELRWRRTPADVTTLAALQRRIGVAAAALVRPGGSLTYSACTWTQEETARVADHIAAETHLEERDRVQLWPHRDGTDGMFHATFR